jgi:hypothetical protein
MSRYIKNQNPKSFNRRKLRILFKKILNHIGKMPNGHFKLMKMRGVCGTCEWEEGIKLDYRKPIIPTLVHEILHDMYPDNREDWVLRLESKVIQVINTRDIYLLMKKFLNKLSVD